MSIVLSSKVQVKVPETGISSRNKTLLVTISKAIFLR